MTKLFVEYTFVSTKAGGDDYVVKVAAESDDYASALRLAPIRGFSHFGARYNDNCVDYRVVETT